MKAGSRFLMVLIGLLLIVAGGVILAALMGWGGATGDRLLAAFETNTLVFLAAGLLLFGIIFLLLGLKSSRSKPPENVLQLNELGEIRLAIGAMENMVLRVVQQTQGVKDVNRRVTHTTQGLVVFIRIRIAPDLRVPDLVGELQAKVKSYLEEVTGFLVHEVKVTVENIIVDTVPLKVK